MEGSLQYLSFIQHSITVGVPIICNCPRLAATPKAKITLFTGFLSVLLRGHCQEDQIKTNTFLSILLFTHRVMEFLFDALSNFEIIYKKQKINK